MLSLSNLPFTISGYHDKPLSRSNTVPASIMILRFRSPDGSYRIDVQPNDDISTLTEKVLNTHPLVD